MCYGYAAEGRPYVICGTEDPGGVERGETKLAKMVCSGRLTPRFLNNDCVTAELTYSAVHAGHGHCVRWALVGPT